jgi:hypothetical protein
MRPAINRKDKIPSTVILHALEMIQELAVEVSDRKIENFFEERYQVSIERQNGKFVIKKPVSDLETIVNDLAKREHVSESVFLSHIHHLLPHTVWEFKGPVAKRYLIQIK